MGEGSQYLWTYHDADGNYLDGAKDYRLHVPPDIPIKNFWSVVVYDTLSRSELQNGQPFPSAATPILRLTPMALSTSSLVLTGPPIVRTGSPPCRDGAGSRSFGFTAPPRPISPRRGSSRTSRRSDENADPLPRNRVPPRGSSRIGLAAESSRYSYQPGVSPSRLGGHVTLWLH